MLILRCVASAKMREWFLREANLSIAEAPKEVKVATETM
jgi:hypothetical protein